MAGDEFLRRPLRIPVPARHGRAAVRGGGRPATSWTAPAASMRRSARTRRCWPIWCAGCWRTAPTPRSSTASPTRRVPVDDLHRRPGRVAAADRAAGAPHPKIALPRELFGRRARQFRGHRLQQRAACWPRWPRACSAAHADVACGADAGAEAPARPVLQSGRSPRHRRPCDRGRRGAGRARARRAAAAPAWHATPPADRAALPAARRRPAEARMPPLLGLIVREAGKPSPTPSPRCARRSIPALLRRAGARRLRQRRRIARSARRLHQPVEFSPGDFHRPDRGRTRRRQSRARQAGRGNAADRRRRRSRSLHEAGVPAGIAAVAARRRRGRRARWSPIRARAAWCSPAPPRSRG